ncbi:MAG: hypothetical protein A3205_08000 [Methanomassiliicoccales archaeon Mx-03]|nr:MAG: hypothetical protein A3205_08000 [Methanomassiliicoccales archaeon Mx-03]
MRSDMSEYEAVEKAAMLFVKSVGSGDSAPARELFYDEAVMFGYLDGKLEHGPIQNLYDNIDSVGADPGYRARIDVLCIEETVAIVRVLEDNWGGRIDFSDFLLLIKMDGEWKGVAKVYNQNSDTIRRD